MAFVQIARNMQIAGTVNKYYTMPINMESFSGVAVQASLVSAIGNGTLGLFAERSMDQNNWGDVTTGTTVLLTQGSPNVIKTIASGGDVALSGATWLRFRVQGISGMPSDPVAIDISANMFNP